MSGTCREVVTLQLGHYSNFIGTHWWNLQDAALVYDSDFPASELQSDVMFREGLTLGGHVTYTPRLIAMDLKGSLQTLRKEGNLYDTENENTAFTWEGQIRTHKESPPTKNAFLQELDNLDTGGLLAEADFTCSSSAVGHCSVSSAGASVAVETVNSSLERLQKTYRLEGSVRVWSDFLRIHLHPRTISVINQYNHDGESERLEVFGQGRRSYRGQCWKIWRIGCISSWRSATICRAFRCCVTLLTVSQAWGQRSRSYYGTLTEGVASSPGAWHLSITQTQAL
ncbi:hypothetical protein QQF64_012971 [Cirrhinus molitorella]|uniref:Misato Segment II tubulin-like domain-containing protein n=1 Tax=Cirrhinus molitorella TaxID=172907 RepID=A0ABR3LR20_9TELE